MPAQYEEIPPQRLAAHIDHTEAVANEVGGIVMTQRINDLGHAVVQLAEDIARRHAPGAAVRTGFSFGEVKENVEHEVTWNMATGRDGQRSPEQEQLLSREDLNRAIDQEYKRRANEQEKDA